MGKSDEEQNGIANKDSAAIMKNMLIVLYEGAGRPNGIKKMANTVVNDATRGPRCRKTSRYTQVADNEAIVMYTKRRNKIKPSSVPRRYVYIKANGYTKIAAV